MLKKKQNTGKKTKPQTNSSPNNKTPKCNTTYPCTFLSHIDDVCDLLLSFVFNLNISVITFYKYPHVFPNIWLAATDFTPFYAVVCPLWSGTKLSTNQRLLFYLSFFTFHNLPYSEGPAKVSCCLWRVRKSQAHPCRVMEKSQQHPQLPNRWAVFNGAEMHNEIWAQN